MNITEEHTAAECALTLAHLQAGLKGLLGAGHTAAHQNEEAAGVNGAAA